MSEKADKPKWEEEYGVIDIMRCSVCGQSVVKKGFLASINPKRLKYCPYCGTKLKKPENIDVWK